MYGEFLENEGPHLKKKGGVTDCYYKEKWSQEFVVRQKIYPTVFRSQYLV